MAATLIKNATVVNEGSEDVRDVRIAGGRIAKIAASIAAEPGDEIVEAGGCILMPGMIDDQVHFREPGLTHKGCIASESRAAVAGGITSFMEMPNVTPATTTIEALEAKYDIAAKDSFANYGFYLGATEDNLEEIKRIDPAAHCGVKVFMGASTGDLLVEHPEALDHIFAESPALIVTHCEHSPMIAGNKERLLAEKGTLTIEDHPVLRCEEACYASSSYAVDLAKRHGSQLHILHITTEKELSLFEPGPVKGKAITAEACVHHLWFSQEDYPRLGNLIKCNPAIKKASDRDAIIEALHTGRIDVVATDHAPHTFEEKQADYATAPAGLPLVQHALLTMMDHVAKGRLSLPLVVEKTAHNPAIRYAVKERGFIREGYFADLVLIDPKSPTMASHETALYHCGWTPFVGHEFTSQIKGTWVNGHKVFDGSAVIAKPQDAQRLVFDRA